MDLPTDNDIIKIHQLILPVLMRTKYDELTLTYNILGFIIPYKRHDQIYKKGAYLIPPVIALYDDTIDKDATGTEFYRAEGKNGARKITVKSTRRTIMPAETSSWTLLMKHGTRALGP